MAARKRLYDAYSAGRQCYEQGGKFHDNPYDDSKPRLKYAWLSGYSDATLNSMNE
jgi:hypothetical protein